jgi:hypothetical protein
MKLRNRHRLPLFMMLQRKKLLNPNLVHRTVVFNMRLFSTMRILRLSHQRNRLLEVESAVFVPRKPFSLNWQKIQTPSFNPRRPLSVAIKKRISPSTMYLLLRLQFPATNSRIFNTSPSKELPIHTKPSTVLVLYKRKKSIISAPIPSPISSLSTNLLNRAWTANVRIVTV